MLKTFHERVYSKSALIFHRVCNSNEFRLPELYLCPEIIKTLDMLIQIVGIGSRTSYELSVYFLMPRMYKPVACRLQCLNMNNNIFIHILDPAICQYASRDNFRTVFKNVETVKVTPT